MLACREEGAGYPSPIPAFQPDPQQQGFLCTVSLESCAHQLPPSQEFLRLGHRRISDLYYFQANTLLSAGKFPSYLLSIITFISM